MSAQEKISIVKIQDSSDIYEKVKAGFELMGKPNLHSNDIVSIKPNLCAIKGPETGSTTDLRVMEAIIRYLQEEFQISDISIVESDGTQLLADMAFKFLGFEKLAKKLNVKLVNLSKDQFTYKVYENNTYMKKIKYPQTLEKTTCLISVPKIKIHTMCILGGTMKNQYGCNPVANKKKYHKRLNDAIADFTVAFKPHIIVVDGIIGMEGRGPVGGIPVKLNTLIFGKDVVAVDHLIARIIGLNPNSVKYLVDAKKRGLGTFNYQLVGANIKDIERAFKAPPKRSSLYGLFAL